MFKNIMSQKTKPQSYKPVLEAPEVIELFSRLTLHQQAALLRLISRNLEIVLNDESHMGYELDYEVVGAMIQATESLD
jgi:hypothetical protein|tara:strand:+ start:255 stop:488 length:234 start_codon:yes stop_codon:yes gene_type:complete